MLTIEGAAVFTPNGIVEHGNVQIENGVIAGINRTDPIASHPEQVIDASGLLLIPGLIDMQCNGVCGHDVLDGTADAIRKLADCEVQFGCTAVLPTCITAPPELMLSVVQAIAVVALEQRSGASVLGAHLEGPWLNPRHHGAHPVDQVRPFSLDEWHTVRDVARNTIRLVTVAPEAAGNDTAVRAIAASGVLVSIGHSGATYAEADAAAADGARMVTHLFNAMSPMYHREPGLPGAALDLPSLIPGIIPDGYHVHPMIVRLASHSRGPNALVVVTDSSPAAGLPPRNFEWAGRTVYWDGESVRFADGGLAGSGLTPIEALRRYMAMTGLSLLEALPTMTSVPARLLGLSQRLGSITPGLRADVVLLTPDLQVHTTIVGGEIAFRSFVAVAG